MHMYAHYVVGTLAYMFAKANILQNPLISAQVRISIEFIFNFLFFIFEFTKIWF